MQPRAGGQPDGVLSVARRRTGLSGRAVPLVAEVPSGLYVKDSHRAIAEAITRLARAGTTVEAGTVQAELERMGRWEIHGHAMLAVIEDEATVAPSLPTYIARLRELAARQEGGLLSRFFRRE